MEVFCVSRNAYLSVTATKDIRGSDFRSAEIKSQLWKHWRMNI